VLVLVIVLGKLKTDYEYEYKKKVTFAKMVRQRHKSIFKQRDICEGGISWLIFIHDQNSMIFHVQVSGSVKNWLLSS
jgi:hypothetical protein